MRTDKFTQMLEALYKSYVSISKRYKIQPIDKRAFMARMRIKEW